VSTEGDVGRANATFPGFGVRPALWVAPKTPESDDTKKEMTLKMNIDTEGLRDSLRLTKRIVFVLLAMTGAIVWLFLIGISAIVDSTKDIISPLSDDQTLLMVYVPSGVFLAMGILSFGRGLGEIATHLLGLIVGRDRKERLRTELIENIVVGTFVFCVLMLGMAMFSHIVKLAP
jgi:hypothetical protein